MDVDRGHGGELSQRAGDLLDPAATDAVEQLGVLGDGHRRQLFGYVRAARRPVTRDEAAAKVGISRKLAAFHLERLVRAGLLEVAPAAPGEPRSPRRPGRPAKAYRSADARIAVSIPERRYELLACILADAAVGQRPGELAVAATVRTARDYGDAMGRRLAEDRRLGRVGPERALSLASELLASIGFEPVEEGTSPRRVHLANCAFEAVAGRAPALVCGANRALVEGLLAGLGSTGVEVAIAPRPDACCVDLSLASSAR